MTTLPLGRLGLRVALAWAALLAVLLAFATSASAAVDNPDLRPACGTKVILVLDESGSIQDTSGAEAAVRNAANAFASGLADTGSQLAVIEFGSSAKRVFDYTDVTSGPSGTLASTFQPYFNGTAASPADVYDSPSQLGEWTNWQDALEEVAALNDASGVAPLVVFITDGEPTAINTQNGVQTGQYSSTAITPAVTAADAVKNQGSHILAVGVGQGLSNSDSLNRLIAISGSDVASTAGDVNLSTTDVLRISDFSSLPAALRSLVNELCQSSITINKVVNEGAGPVPGGAGWQFGANVTPSSGTYTWITPQPGNPGPRSATTGDDSAVTFQWKPSSATTSTVTITETPKTGYEFVGANCSVRTTSNPKPEPLQISTDGASFTATVHSTDIVSCTVENRTAPSLAITKTVDQPKVLAGTAVTWTVRVTNTGPVALNSVAVADPIAPGCAKTIGNLEVGAFKEFTCSSKIDTDTTNTATATGKGPSGANVPPKSASASVDVISPGLSITKKVDKPVILAGTKVTWTVTVKNTGDTALEDVTVTDPNAPGCSADLGTLAAHTTAPAITCSTTPTVDTVNTATVTGVDSFKRTLTAKAQASVDVIHPGIDITKSVDSAQVAPGTQVTYTITVTNTGDVALSNVTVADPITPACAKQIGSLAAGAKVIYTCAATITADTTNVATATGRDQLGNSYTKSDDAVVKVVAPPINPTPPVTPTIVVSGAERTKLGIDKRGPANATGGQVITYTVKVTNAGPIAAQNVVIRDLIPSSMSLAKRTRGIRLLNSRLVIQVGTLAPGQSKTVRIRLRIDRLASGMRTNVATASASNAATVRDTARTRIAALGSTGIPGVTG